MQRKAFDVGRGRRGPLLLMPSATDDPLAGLGLFDGARHLVDDIIPRARLPQVEAHAIFAEPSEMPMALNESGDGQHPMQVDHAGVRADPSLRGLVRAE